MKYFFYHLNYFVTAYTSNLNVSYLLVTGHTLIILIIIAVSHSIVEMSWIYNLGSVWCILKG